MNGEQIYAYSIVVHRPLFIVYRL